MIFLCNQVIRMALIGAILAATACAPRVQAPGVAVGNARPVLEDDAIRTADGVRLPLKRWPAQDPKAIVLALHGMNDYANAFAMVGGWWAEQADMTVYAYDQRGFGGTDQRGIWPGPDLLIQDAAAAVSLLKARHPDRPVILLGHSMGGAVALAAVAEGEARPDAVILAAPAVWGWSTLPFPYRAALWTAAHTLPWKTLSGGRAGVTPSDNQEVLEDMSADPMVIKETRIDAAYGLVTLMDRGYRAARPLAVPTLLLYGQKDDLVPEEPVRTVIDRMCPGGTLLALIYQDSYHMLLRDRGAQPIWADGARWVDALLTGPAREGAQHVDYAGETVCPSQDDTDLSGAAQ